MNLKTIGRWALGVVLITAGVSHLTFKRTEFAAQVPGWVPLGTNLVVVLSGIIEIAFGLALITLASHRVWVGWIVAAFFVAIFPGNISQLVTQTDAFGLNSDTSRAIRLLFQPLLVLWALWSTDAWKERSTVAARWRSA